MTLFDSIRYPISDLPTPEQLDALPTDIFNAWVLGTKNCDRFIGFNSQDITWFYERRQWTDNSIPELRKLILEWNTK